MQAQDFEQFFDERRVAGLGAVDRLLRGGAQAVLGRLRGGGRGQAFKVCIDKNDDVVGVDVFINGEPYPNDKVIRNLGLQKYHFIIEKARKQASLL